MFSNNLKRSVATLGVVAGLLAAAVPASAMSGSISGKEMTDAIAGKAPTNAGTQVGSEGVKAPANADEQMKDNVKAAVVLIGANDYGWTEGNDQPCQCEDIEIQ